MSLIAMGRDLPTRTKGVQAFGLEEDKPAARTEGKTQQAMDVLTKFIPTEVLAPFATALSLSATHQWNANKIYVWFVVATPFLFFLFEYAKTAMDNQPWPAVPSVIWRAIAATIAFAVWGLSVPTNPLQTSIGGAAVAGFVAMAVSPVLSALDTILMRALRGAS